jgi:hypothetical protein
VVRVRKCLLRSWSDKLVENSNFGEHMHTQCCIACAPNYVWLSTQFWQVCTVAGTSSFRWLRGQLFTNLPQPLLYCAIIGLGARFDRLLFGEVLASDALDFWCGR